jgi:DNA-binding MarR family transcriptional regulator
MRNDAGTPRLSYLVRSLERGIRAHLDETLRAFGLSTPEYTTLSVLRQRDGLSSAQLARRTFVTPQAMNQLITGLDRRGMISRCPDPANRKILRTSITEIGSRTLARCDEAVDEVEHVMLAGLTRERADLLRATLETCIQSLRDAD